MIDCGKYVFQKEEKSLHIRLIDCGDSVEFSQFYMAHITHNYTEVNWTSGGKKKKKKNMQEDFSIERILVALF